MVLSAVVGWASASSSSLAASGIEVPGVPGVDYPAFPHIPSTDFECSRRTSGYYADTDTRCQVKSLWSSRNFIQSNSIVRNRSKLNSNFNNLRKPIICIGRARQIWMANDMQMTIRRLVDRKCTYFRIDVISQYPANSFRLPAPISHQEASALKRSIDGQWSLPYFPHFVPSFSRQKRCNIKKY